MAKQEELIKKVSVYYTNRQYINAILDPDDVTKILRVWDWYCAKKLDPKAPIWEKEDLYERWLDEPFDVKAWEQASIPYAKGTIPADFARSIKWAYRMSERETKPKKGKIVAIMKGEKLTSEEFMEAFEGSRIYKKEVTAHQDEADFKAVKVW